MRHKKHQEAQVDAEHGTCAKESQRFTSLASKPLRSICFATVGQVQDAGHLEKQVLQAGQHLSHKS